MFDWNSCVSFKRFGPKHSMSDARSDFRRDYDKIIFLSAFRRLQNKTQVFPLPGNVFVHNRLTHSLEVSCVGRSIGQIVGDRIAKKNKDVLPSILRKFYKYDLEDVIASACLAHDLGNPAFGHSGEKAISNYFVTHKNTIIGDKTLHDYFTKEQWADLTNFEGNANALRMLTHHYPGRVDGGHRLMYLTLISIVKYPGASTEINKSKLANKKYGYFQSELAEFHNISQEFGIAPNTQVRHPFVYIVEAADDICYRIIDMEDAHRIGIIDQTTISGLFLQLIRELKGNEEYQQVSNRYIAIGDANEAISFLRAKCILYLVEKVADLFLENEIDILEGKINDSLLDLASKDVPVLHDINTISIAKIYNHKSVIEIEMAGYTVMSELLAQFVEAALRDQRTSLQSKILQLVPSQFQTFSDPSPYTRAMSILDFVSGMTDGYATELYRKIKGIDIPSHTGY